MSVYGYRYGRVPEALLHSDASDRACRLHAILTRWADTRPGENPTREELADLLRCSVDSIDRAVKELVRGKFLEVQPQYAEDGKARIANDYVLEGGRTTAGGGSRTDAATSSSGNGEPAGKGGRTGAAGGGRTGAAAKEERDRTQREQKKEERALAVTAVYEAWRDDTGRNGTTKLTTDRRAKINARLDEDYTVEQLVAVVTDGWRADPWPERMNQNELTQLLTTATKVDKFLRLAEQARHPQMTERQRALAATAAKLDRSGRPIPNGDPR